MSVCRLLSQRLGLENTSEIHFGTLETLMIKSDCSGKIHEMLAGKIKFPIAGSYNTDLRLDILGKALRQEELYCFISIFMVLTNMYICLYTYTHTNNWVRLAELNIYLHTIKLVGEGIFCTCLHTL